MAGLPGGFTKGLLWGGLAAVLWGMLANRHRRTAVAEGVVRGAVMLPFVGAHVNEMLARQLIGFYRAVAEDLVSEARTGELLELGSGAGYLAVEIGLRARDLQITTMDALPFMVQVTESRIHGSGLGRQVKVAQGAPEDIPYSDQSFDLVLSAGVFHRWADPGTALSEIHRVLRPGGRAWIYDLRREMPEEGWELVRERIPTVDRLLFDVAVGEAWRAARGEGEIAALLAGSPFAQAQVGTLTADLAGMKVPALTRLALTKAE